MQYVKILIVSHKSRGRGRGIAAAAAEASEGLHDYNLLHSAQ